jgi:hypothetical protein
MLTFSAVFFFVQLLPIHFIFLQITSLASFWYNSRKMQFSKLTFILPQMSAHRYSSYARLSGFVTGRGRQMILAVEEVVTLGSERDNELQRIAF